MKRSNHLLLVLSLGLACVVPATAATVANKTAAKNNAQAQAQQFLDFYNPVLQRINAVASDAAWIASTDVSPQHEGERTGAYKVYAAFIGHKTVIEQCRALLARKAELDPLTVRQLERIMLLASEAPGTIPDVVNKRVELESKQSSLLDGWEFCLQRDKSGACTQPTTANGIDKILVENRKLEDRLVAWKASKETGAILKPGVAAMRDVRNQVAREMGYSSYFALQVADYGMTVPEMMSVLEQLVQETRPLYQQLHCYARHTLAQRYGEKNVPRQIPAHWLGNRWSQSWPGLVQGVDMDALFKDKTPQWVVKTAEQFYTSMGLPPLPTSFYQKSDLYPVPKGDPRKKNSHASAWHTDFDQDVRSLMSVEANADWFSTAHHELGHIHYYLAYSRPDVPIVLRDGANRSFHEGMGDLIAIASMQQPYLHKLGLLPSDNAIDQTQWLLDEAMEGIVFIPWGAGVMTHFEHDLYEKNLPADQFNKVWWDYVARFQGVVPPVPRDETQCDACTKTHINDDPAQYYDYALARIVKYQLHDHICRKILKKDPHACDYSGNKEVGQFLMSIMKLGATQDWRQVIRQATGKDLSTTPLSEYYAPVLEYLKKQNAGRDCSW